MFPPRLREALHLQNPRDVFPYAMHAGRGKDIDHPTGTRPLPREAARLIEHAIESRSRTTA